MQFFGFLGSGHYGHVDATAEIAPYANVGSYYYWPDRLEELIAQIRQARALEMFVLLNVQGVFWVTSEDHPNPPPESLWTLRPDMETRFEVLRSALRSAGVWPDAILHADEPLWQSTLKGDALEAGAIWRLAEDAQIAVRMRAVNHVLTPHTPLRVCLFSFQEVDRLTDAMGYSIVGITSYGLTASELRPYLNTLKVKCPNVPVIIVMDALTSANLDRLADVYRLAQVDAAVVGILPFSFTTAQERPEVLAFYEQVGRQITGKVEA